MENYKKINKRSARKAFNEGKTVYLCPCNLRPFTMWHPECPVSNNSKKDFNKIVNAFEYYNCANGETGRRAAYYVAEA